MVGLDYSTPSLSLRILIEQGETPSISTGELSSKVQYFISTVILTIYNEHPKKLSITYISVAGVCLSSFLSLFPFIVQLMSEHPP